MNSPAAARSAASKFVDFRSHALGRDFKRRKRNRQVEAPPSRATGIEVQNAADRLDLRYVGMPGDDDVDAGAGIGLQRLQVMQDVDRLSRQSQECRVRVLAGPLTTVHVSTDRGNRRDPAKRIDDLRAPDVAGMDDVIDTRQASFRLRPQQAVRVRNDSNLEHHFPALSPRARRKTIEKLHLPGEYLRSCELNIEPFRAVDFRKVLSPAASGRPFNIEHIARQCRGVKTALSGERDDAFASALANLP